ncbi:SpoVR family protein [Aureibacter tunicatorum]|uniref:Spore cortex formation protein SpoVR/YcgB (Stage V sporulation) n=1 Tax=Aureibacter tunicatorum TaxID=866807 RepID=A0AAE4BSX5_9BACT|nr:SpoVR family protein [Aureibacter tunicatorum]MDR6238872.1 spore cortex formation protein SpoVR/YcgB (stage V sporulation) [Aureibacter tunicatorum]BDD05201.1 SpoVR family protein [Aureibacter tunicatorum]
MDKKARYRELFSNAAWNIDTLKAADEVTSRIGSNDFKLDIYKNQIEVVTSEQMLDAYSLIGLPTSYPHWKFGKSFSMNQEKYSKGYMGLSYEMVINSDPCISYNMETNTTCLMVLVIAHACQGHNAFFKGNYMFKDWTSADSIVDYMVFARDFVMRCEEEFGQDEVEHTLDACHALMSHGVDQYRRPDKRSFAQEKDRLKKLVEIKRENFNDLWRTIPHSSKEKEKTPSKANMLSEPENNILYFIEKNGQKLPAWKRELVRIVRKVAQYFYPQSQTKVMNEGFATFMHYHIVNQMQTEGYLDEGFMLEFYHHHSNVLYQPPYNSDHFSGINPYTLGFNIFMDIKRICTEPTQEDKEWFPYLIGKNWLDEVHFAMENFRDDSFILQYLSPKVMRDMKLFSIEDKFENDYYEVNAIHDGRGYKGVREALSRQYNRGTFVPNIQIESVEPEGDKIMKLVHTTDNEQVLEQKSAAEVLRCVKYLWGHQVQLDTVTLDGEKVRSYKY